VTLRQNLRRHWKRWLLGSVVVVVLVAVVAPFVYIHFIEGPAPSRFHLSRPSNTAGAATAPLDGTWRIGVGSQAGYRVQETLFGQSNTAVGRTTAVTGQLSIAGSQVTTSSVVVDLTQVASDQSQRDHQFQGRIMDTSMYPTATFTLSSPIPLNPLPADGVTITIKAAGTLTVHGSTHPASADLQARRSGNSIQVSGSIPVAFSTWNIPNPTFGPASTGDTGLIEFLLSYANV
jgi:polyisoprenoid-binding protein YceI